MSGEGDDGGRSRAAMFKERLGRMFPSIPTKVLGLIGLFGIVIGVFFVIVYLMNPLPKVLEAGELNGEDTRYFEADLKYVVIDFDCYRTGTPLVMDFTIIEDGTNRTVHEGTTTVRYRGEEYVSSDYLFLRIEGNGRYHILMRPKPVPHEGTYEVTVYHTDLSKETRQQMDLISIILVVTVIVLAFIALFISPRDDAGFMRTYLWSVVLLMTACTIFLFVSIFDEF